MTRQLFLRISRKLLTLPPTSKIIFASDPLPDLSQRERENGRDLSWN